jgi:hypothetical protein
MQMKAKWILPLLLLIPLPMFGQTLGSGAVVFAMPVVNAYEFTLMSGGFQEQAQLNGFHFGTGTFHLWKNGGPGACLTGTDPNIPGCRFDGSLGTMTATKLDKDCTQISFPINNGELQILTDGNGVTDHKNVTATYSQTFCNVDGSLFMAGGTLVVQLK